MIRAGGMEFEIETKNGCVTLLRVGTAVHPAEEKLARRVQFWLSAYFAGENPDPREIPLAPEGTDFQKRVWAALLRIPYGRTVTYGQLAAEIFGDKPSCPQAIGQAVGKNPIWILIPCHRVVGAKGSLTGYAGGLALKKRLLETEHASPLRL